MQIQKAVFEKIIASSSYATGGDDIEKAFEIYFKDIFKNSEVFWKKFIVPATNRIVEQIPENTADKIRFRENISSELKEIFCFHYSVFLNIMHAHKVFEARHISFFENFYAHLGSACDSIEEF